MINLIAATTVFLLIHFGISGTRLRDVLVGRLGEGPYRGLFSLASLAGIVWMSSAYTRAPAVLLWGDFVGSRPLAMALMLVAVLLVVIGLASPNPVMAGMESRLARGQDTARGITRITRHPFLWGVALWALVHLSVNGDLASLILFGSLLLLALAGAPLIEARWRRRFGERWNTFAQATSNVPFAAIAAGRNQLGPALREIGILRPLLALAVYAALLVFHGRLFGVNLVGAGLL
ncbi:MAG: NnrU family protein [Dongiaceae bacterium]